MTRKRSMGQHPTSLRSVRDHGHLHAVPELPPVLPTLVPGDDEDPEVDPYDVFEMSLPLETLRWLHDNNISVTDAFEGKVPGIDPEAVVAKAMEETRSHNGPWSPFE